MNPPMSLDDLLIAHAAGQLPEPVALVVATHLALSPASRRRYQRYEALGGQFLEDIPPEALETDALTRALERLDEQAAPTKAAEVAAAVPPSALPRPLRDYLPPQLNQLPWRSYGFIAEADLPVPGTSYRTRLIRLRAGFAAPRHTHQGFEMTLVLDGAFKDATGRFRRGDVEIADASIDHKPVALSGRDCLCLAVTDAPLRLTGRFTRFFNPFMRI